MSRILGRASRRHFQRHPWQLGLSILGVALGVAVVLSIDLANASALRAFRVSSDTLTGRATHRVEGGPQGLPETLYRELRVEAALRATAPVVEGWVTAGEGARTLRLLGIDPFAEAAFRDWTPGGEGLDPGELLTRPGAVTLTGTAAAELGVAVGDALPLTVGGARRVARVAGLLPAASGGALDDLLLADLATAQELLGMVGRLSRIDLAAPPEPERAAFLEAVAARLPPTATIRPAGAVAEAAAGMTRAFRTNLQALSLLALMCGTFLIYNTVSFTVVQRRQLFGVLRCLGATRRQLAARIAIETLAIGSLGTGCGLLLGSVLGRSLVARVTQTINDLYFVVSVRQVALPPEALLKAALLGIAASLLAAAAPAWEALGTQPRSALDRIEIESKTRRALPVAGALALLAGAVAALLLLRGASLAASFGGLFAALLALALLTPLATLAVLRLATPLAARLLGPLGRLAGRGLSSSLSRTAVAIAALMIAISVAVGVDLMIRSFRGTVAAWLEHSLPADLYVSTGARPGASGPPVVGALEPALLDELAALPEVGALNAIRHAEVTDAAGERLQLRAFDLERRGRGAFRFVRAGVADPWAAFEDGAVLISESLAFRRHLAPGDTLSLRTARGVRALGVAAVFTDYATDRGALMMSRSVYARLWDDRRLTALSLYAAPGVEPAALERAARAVLSGRPALRLRSNRELRLDSLAVFDRTFLVTGVLRLLAILVAVAGILSALTALLLERQRELAVLRANGLTPAQLWLLVLTQTGLMGLVAGLLALPTGVAMAALMVEVINRRSFGWSMDLALAPAPLAGALFLALGAALAAGLLPAFRAARISPAEALRGE